MSTQPKKKQKVEPKGKDGLTKSERMREQDEKLMRERSKQRAKERMEEKNKEDNEKAQKERREKAQKERLKNQSKKSESKQSGKDKLKKDLRTGKKPKEGKKLPGEGVEKTPAKMPDGFTMDRPAHKLGYIQKLGAGRMSPGKMGDMTAMKMMHGDAAAKYYDGAGMYMNGAPKYEGASKSYMGPGAHKAGHIEGIPSYTTTNTTTTRSGGESTSVTGSNSGGTSSSSGGSSSGRTNFSSDPEERARQKQWIKDNPEAYKKALAEKKKKSTSTSSSSTSTSSSSTKPTVKTETKKETKTVGTQTQQDVLGKGQEMLQNRANRIKAEREAAMIQAQKDSIKVANQKIGKFSGPLTQQKLDIGHRYGQSEGKRSLSEARGSDGKRLFGQSELQGFFNSGSGRTKERGTGVGEKPHKKISKRNPEVMESYTVGSGTLGERPMLEDYTGGTPKMPKGPMKFGMRK